MALKFSDDFLIGHATIDRQHRELFRAFNDLLEACRQGHGKEKVEQLLDFLDMYVVFHFDAEQGLMAEYRYPGFSEHCAEHAQFLAKLQGLKASFRASGPTSDLLVTINEELLRWIVGHIRKTDTALAGFLGGRGAVKG